MKIRFNPSPINLLTLRFQDASLEAGFWLRQRSMMLRQIRVGFGLLTVLFIGLIVFQLSFSLNTLASNMGYACLGLLTLFIFSLSDTKVFKKHSQVFVTIYASFVGAGLIYLNALLPQSTVAHTTVLLLMTVWVCIFAGLSFKAVVLVASVLAVSQFLTVWSPVSDFVASANMVAFMLALTFGLSVAYFNERVSRVTYLMQRMGKTADQDSMHIESDWAAINSDWDLVLKELVVNLASSHDIELMFNQLLLLMSNTIVYDAAAVVKYSDQKLEFMNGAGEFSDKQDHDDIMFLWPAELVRKIRFSKDVNTSAMDIADFDSQSTDDNLIFANRLDIPIFTQGDLIGLVSLFRRTAEFNDYEIKIGASMVFHAMYSLRGARMEHDLKRLAKEKEDLSVLQKFKDPAALPVLLSRNEFIDKASMVFNELRQKGKPVSVLLLEIDDNFVLSDKFGADAVRELYKSVADLLLGRVRDVDLIGEYGEAAFAIQVPMDLQATQELAERLRNIIADNHFPMNANIIDITVSIGVSTLAEESHGFMTVLRSADMGLFLAKDANGNSVRVSV